MKRMLITGCSGFIGMHLSKRLLKRGHNIFGIDNMNNYNDQSLKESRLANLIGFSNFTFKKIDISEF